MLSFVLCNAVKLYCISVCILINKPLQLTEETTFVRTLFLSLYSCLKKPTKEAEVVGIEPMQSGDYNVVADLVLRVLCAFTMCR